LPVLIIEIVEALFLFWPKKAQYIQQVSMAKSIMDEMPDKQAGGESAADKLRCLNCYSEISDRFCARCGQDSRQFQQSVWKIFGQFLGNLFDLDGKILLSLKPLLFSPGKLTVDFLEGKRRSQLNPFQMYAFFSFLFFLTAFQLPEIKSMEKVQNPEKPLSQSNSPADSTRFSFQAQRAWAEIFKQNNLKGLAFEYDSTQKTLPENKRDKGFALFFKSRMNTFGDRLRGDEQVFEDLLANMKSNIPNSLIILLPFFAFILKLLYIRRPFFYIDHLVFSIHLFSFLFLTGSFAFIFGTYLPDYLTAILFLSIPVYFTLAMRRVFRQSWLKTILKLGFITLCFTLIMTAGLFLNFFVAVLFQS
jgi:hypothetical protein